MNLDTKRALKKIFFPTKKNQPENNVKTELDILIDLSTAVKNIQENIDITLFNGRKGFIGSTSLENLNKHKYCEERLNKEMMMKYNSNEIQLEKILEDILRDKKYMSNQITNVLSRVFQKLD